MDIKYHEGRLDSILNYYCETAFKEKGWYVIAVDIKRGTIIFKSDELSRNIDKRWDALSKKV